MISCSVVICAYTLDRWADLTAAADSVFAGQHRPQQLIVVIDHNEDLLSRARTHFPEMEYEAHVLVMPNAHRRGLSGARNTAVEHATEDVVVFLDDDAQAEPAWLGELLTHYAQPAVIGVGGLAEPVWPQSTAKQRPALLPAASAQARGELDWVVGCTYQGLPEVFAPVRNLMGCNMSYRRSAFASVGGFSENLGRVGRTPLGGEETELCIRIRNDDPQALLIFEPKSVVHHRVTPDRVRWKHLVSRCYSEGLSKATIAKMVGQDSALESERNYVARVLTRAVVREVGRAVRGRKSGLTGACALTVGLGFTTLGYVRGSLTSRSRVPLDAATFTDRDVRNRA